MLSEIARIAIRHLNKNGFEAFVKYLIENDSNFYTARSLTNIDERIIECPPERYYQSADAFFLNYHPTSLYKDFSLRNIDFDCLEKMISNYLKNRTYSLWLPNDGTTIYSINNYDSSNLGISDEELLYYYEKILCGLLSKDVRLGIGNVNTFLQKAESEGRHFIRKLSPFGFCSQPE